MNIFFPSGGRRVELIGIFKEKVRKLSGRIIVGDIVNSSPALYTGDRSYLLPKFNSEDCYEVLKKIYRDEKIDLIIPLLDYELDYYVANYEKLQADKINVMMSDPSSVAIFRNKKNTNDLLKRLGVPVPLQYRISEGGDKKRPFIIKPVRGSAGMKISLIKDDRELQTLSEQIGHERLNSDFVIEEFLEGTEVTSDVFIDFEGRIRGISQRERLKIRGGEVERAKIVEYRDINRFIEIIFTAVRGFGVLNIQCFVDANGPKFTEINARFGGGYPLSYRAGSDFPSALINMYMNRPIGEMCSIIGYHMLRYDNAVYLHGNELIDG